MNFTFQFAIRLMAVVVIVLLAACVQRDIPNQTGVHPWTKATIEDLHLELADSQQIERMHFRSDHSVVMTYGFTKKGHSSIAMPICTWRIVNGRLQVVGEHKKVYDEWQMLTINNSEIVTKRKSGVIASYYIWRESPELRRKLLKLNEGSRVSLEQGQSVKAALFSRSQS